MSAVSAGSLVFGGFNGVYQNDMYFVSPDGGMVRLLRESDEYIKETASSPASIKLRADGA
jgi:hypothetical protein